VLLLLYSFYNQRVDRLQMEQRYCSMYYNVTSGVMMVILCDDI